MGEVLEEQLPSVCFRKVLILTFCKETRWPSRRVYVAWGMKETESLGYLKTGKDSNIYSKKESM